MPRPSLFSFFFIIVLVSAVQAENWDRIYDRPAVKGKKFVIPEDHGDEIDREIEEYFKKIESDVKLDIDGKKLFSLFGPASQEEEDEDEKEGPAARNAIREVTSDFHSWRVKKHDTIRKIARANGVTPWSIVKHNPFLRERPLHIGEEALIVKKERKRIRARARYAYHRVRGGDTLWRLSRKYGVSVALLRRWNRLKKGSVMRIGSSLKVSVRRGAARPRGYMVRPLFIMPVQGKITSRFGHRKNPFTGFRSYHRGLDIGAAMGAPVRAARDGIVIQAARMGAYGNTILIRHPGGYISAYAHNKIMEVKRGDAVKQGQRIARVGRTGHATGPHSHFEIRERRRSLNPVAAMRLKEYVPIRTARKESSDAGG